VRARTQAFPASAAAASPRSKTSTIEKPSGGQKGCDAPQVRIPAIVITQIGAS